MAVHDKRLHEERDVLIASDPSIQLLRRPSRLLKKSQIRRPRKSTSGGATYVRRSDTIDCNDAYEF